MESGQRDQLDNSALSLGLNGGVERGNITPEKENSGLNHDETKSDSSNEQRDSIGAYFWRHSNNAKEILSWFQGHFTSINIRSFYISCFNRLSNFIFHIIRFTFDVWRSTIQSRPDIVDHRKKTELYRLKTQSFVFNLIASLFRSNYKDLLNYIINYTCLGMARN